jgi:hypothetical protein
MKTPPTEPVEPVFTEEEHALNQEIGFGAAAFLREMKQAYEAELRMAQGEQARKDAA